MTYTHARTSIYLYADTVTHRYTYLALEIHFGLTVPSLPITVELILECTLILQADTYTHRYASTSKPVKPANLNIFDL
jgi:hypothetical protein